MVQGVAPNTFQLHELCQFVMGPFLCPTHLTTIHYNMLADSTVRCTELNFPQRFWESSYFWSHEDDSETLIPQSRLPWHGLHINN